MESNSEPEQELEEHTKAGARASSSNESSQSSTQHNSQERARELIDELESLRMDASRAPVKEHLTELRGRIIAYAKAWFICLIVALIIHEQLYLLITTPMYESLARFELEDTIKFRTVNGPLMFYFKVCIISSFLASAPFAFHQAWSFVKPGLYESEQRVTSYFVSLTSFFFFSGVLFSYVVVMPFAFDYNLGFSRIEGPQKLLPDITLEDYLSTFTSLTLLVGATFITPIVIGFLSYFGVVSYQTLKGGWRWATVASFVLAAIITPPDYVTQLLVAIPLASLYWVGVLLAYLIEKRRGGER